MSRGQYYGSIKAIPLLELRHKSPAIFINSAGEKFHVKIATLGVNSASVIKEDDFRPEGSRLLEVEDTTQLFCLMLEDYFNKSLVPVLPISYGVFLRKGYINDGVNRWYGSDDGKVWY